VALVVTETWAIRRYLDVSVLEEKNGAAAKAACSKHRGATSDSFARAR
jgi:hypothetical protein